MGDGVGKTFLFWFESRNIFPSWNQNEERFPYFQVKMTQPVVGLLGSEVGSEDPTYDGGDQVNPPARPVLHRSDGSFGGLNKWE